jgi:hypothetical protein
VFQGSPPHPDTATIAARKIKERRKMPGISEMIGFTYATANFIGLIIA